MPTLTQSSTHSSDYFDDDPEFLKALSELPLPEPEPEQDAGHRSLSVAEEPNSGPSQVPTSPDDEEPPRTQPSRKRARSLERPWVPEEDSDDSSGANYHNVLNAVDANDDDDGGYLRSHTYGASRFGEFGEYMARKRAKLQIQNAEEEEEEEPETETVHSRIFQGVQIYVRSNHLWMCVG